MKYLYLLILLSSVVHAEVFNIFQYPEDRPYTSADHGIHPYRALSLYKTHTFTLTFDDGPHPTRTALMLDVLKKHGVKGTFFVLTRKINENNFYLIKRMLDEGHLVGSHGPTHDRAADLTKEEWKAQTKESFLALAKWYKKAGYEFNKLYYRFPYGDYGTRKDYHTIDALKEVSQELMGDNCIQMAFWDIDTADWVPGMTGAEVAQNIVANIEGGIAIDFKLENGSYVKVPYEIKDPPGGGVVLEHDIHEETHIGIDLFIQYAKDHGVHLPRLDEVEEFKVKKNCKL